MLTKEKNAMTVIPILTTVVAITVFMNSAATVFQAQMKPVMEMEKVKLEKMTTVTRTALTLHVAMGL